jgi:AraC family transcriptional regulator, regulatory protein of adaptative response / methylated-DNA-[protein]-cysteine methyltransferase
MATASLGPMPTLRFARVETSIGRMWVAETDAGVAAISRSEPFPALERRFPEASVEPGAVDGSWIDAALGGGPLPPVDLGGLSPFDAAVYQCVRQIPSGETLTYGEVAALIGSPGAARAVGGAMSRCPLFPAVPCHRVVRASDGWSGWGSDPALKRRLLAAERGAGG